MTNTMQARLDRTFEYGATSIGDMAVNVEVDKAGNKIVKAVKIKEEELQPTQRFWTSLFARFGFNNAFFKYFGHDEVFARIASVSNRDRLRYVIDRCETGDVLLAATNPESPGIGYDPLIETLEKYEAEGITYHEGCVSSRHTPRVGSNAFKIGGHTYHNRFVLETPIDGYGRPSVYIALQREDGAVSVGYGKKFKSELSVGKGDEVSHSVVRALEGFNHDEGYAAIRQRFEMAQLSWASVNESNTLYKLLLKLMHNNHVNGTIVKHDDHAGSNVITTFHEITGDTCKLYGLANLDSLAVKRQRTLPVRCTVLDLVDYASNLSTTQATEHGARALQSWVGNLIGDDFDMEGTRSKSQNFNDFFMTDSAHKVVVE